MRGTSSFIAWRSASSCAAEILPDVSSIVDTPAAANAWNPARWRRMSNGEFKEAASHEGSRTRGHLGARRTQQCDVGSCALGAVAHQQSSRHWLDEHSWIGNAHLVLRKRPYTSKSRPGNRQGFLDEAGAEWRRAFAQPGQDRSAHCGQDAAAGSNPDNKRIDGHAAAPDSARGCTDHHSLWCGPGKNSSGTHSGTPVVGGGFLAELITYGACRRRHAAGPGAGAG